MDRRLGVVALAMLAVLFVVGCGSGGSGATTSSVPVKADYTQRAEAICAQGLRAKNAALKQALEAAAGTQKYASPKAQEELITQKLLPPLRAMEEELADLSPPSAQRAEVDAMVKSLQDGISLAEGSPLIAVTHEGKIFGDWNRRARRFGLQTCAQIT